MQKMIIIALLLAGCTSVSEVTRIGKDTYMVGAADSSGLSSRADMKAMSVKRAAQFCESQGKTMVTNSMDAHGGGGWSATESEITFFCVDENDPANARVKLRKAPDTIVEIRK